MKSTPKIIWQTWKTKKEIPPPFHEYTFKWKKLHKSYDYELIDDEDLLNIVKKVLPQYVEKYKNFTYNIERVDFARYALLYYKGGVYADLDTYPLKNIDKWVNKNKIVLGCEPYEHSINLYNKDKVVCNAIMISPPSENFWIDLMKYIIDNYEHNFRPVDNTGPMAINNFLESPKGKEYKNDLVITDPCIFYPVKGDGSVSKECNIEDSYVIHEWKNTWVLPWYQSKSFFNTRYWVYISLIVFAVLWLWCFQNKYYD